MLPTKGAGIAKSGMLNLVILSMLLMPVSVFTVMSGAVLSTALPLPDTKIEANLSSFITVIGSETSLPSEVYS